MPFVKIEKGVVVQKQPDVSADDIGFMEVDDSVICGMVLNSDGTFSAPAPDQQAVMDRLNNLNWELREERIAEGPVCFGVNPPCDTRTMAFFSILLPMAQADSAFVYPGYRAKNGVYDLTAQEIIVIAKAGFELVRDSFLTFNAVEQKILSGEIVTPEAVKEAYKKGN